MDRSVRKYGSLQPRYRKSWDTNFFSSVHYRIATTICGIAASETYIYSYTSICIVPNMMLTQIPRRKQVLPRVQVLSRLGTDTTSTPAAAAAAAVPGLESTKGSAPGVTSGSTEPKYQWLRQLRPSCSRSPFLSPLSSCSARPLCSYAVNF